MEEVGGCYQYKHLLEQYDWNVELALEVCENESGGKREAYNGEYHDDADCYGSVGLFQIACVHGFTKEEMFVPEANIEYAYTLYQRRGWQPWGVCHDGKVDCGL